jgi:AAA+ ATPase superfamily predicted ATPase
MKIIGRQKELSVLDRCLRSPKPEFLAVYGRRRVGKTYLIREYLKDRIAFSLTGVAGLDKAEQLQRFDDAMEAYGAVQESPTKDWFAAFKRLQRMLAAKLADADGQGKMVVFIDELPWLATKKSNLVSALEHFWNSWGSTCPQLLLVVCGSATSWIIDNVIHNHGGLHNRVTRKMRIEPFTLAECEEYYRY